MAAKKEWQKPELEMLEVHRTMASSVDGPYTDEAYVPGEEADAPYYRFTS